MLQTSDTIDNRPFLCYIFYMTEETEKNEKPSYNRLRGCHKNIPGASVEDFLARSRADKEHELEIERRAELEASYQAMAADAEYEREAMEWCNGLMTGIDDETPGRVT